jgi:hypothetical protein
VAIFIFYELFAHKKFDDFCVNVHQQGIRKQEIHCLMIMSLMASLNSIVHVNTHVLIM